MSTSETFPRARIAEILEREAALRNDDRGEGGVQELIDELHTALGGRKDTVARMLYRMRVGKARRRDGSTYIQEVVSFHDVDAVLQALDLTHLWRSELADLAEHDGSGTASDEEHDCTCGGCGKIIDWSAPAPGVRVEMARMVNVRRRWSWWSLCALCCTSVLPIAEAPESGDGRFVRRIPADELKRLYRRYITEGIGINLLAEEVAEKWGYSTAASCQSTIHQAWKVAGWPMRTRSETKALNRANGHTKPVACRRISDDDLRKAHVLHMRANVSANQLGKQLAEKYGYRRPSSCAMAITTGWKRLGLQPRDRIEMCVAVSTKHGLAPRDRKERARLRTEAGLTTNRGKPLQPRCIGTSKKSKQRCDRPANEGSEFCWAHDPASQAMRQAQLAAMRARSPRFDPANQTTVGEIQESLRAAYELFGRQWKPLERATGFSNSQMIRWLKDPPEKVMMKSTAAAIRHGLEVLTAMPPDPHPVGMVAA